MKNKISLIVLICLSVVFLVSISMNTLAEEGDNVINSQYDTPTPFIFTPTPTPQETPTPTPQIPTPVDNVTPGPDDITDEEMSEGEIEGINEVEEVLEQDIPEGTKNLPKTGGIPAEAFYITGGFLLILSLMTFIKK